MTAALFAAIVAIVFSATAVQRITGIGFSLISAPLLVLALGPTTGVLLANLLNFGVNLLVLAQTWREVDGRRVLTLAVPALCFVPVGEAVARALPPSVLMAGIGASILAALSAVRLLQRATVLHGTGGAVVAGALSGFMNVTAGVAGPALTLYAIGTRWPQRTFVGSAQLFFAIVNAGSMAAKGLPSVPPALLGCAIAALAAGVGAGHLLHRRIPPERARGAVVVIAALGAAATVVKGVLLMVGPAPIR